MTKKLSSLAIAALSFLFFVASATCAPAPGKATTTTRAAAAATTQPDFWGQMTATPDPTAAPQPKWIWGKADAKAGEDRYFRTTFDAKIPTTYMTENPSAAWIWCAGDDEITV